MFASEKQSSIGLFLQCFSIDFHRICRAWTLSCGVLVGLPRDVCFWGGYLSPSWDMPRQTSRLPWPWLYPFALDLPHLRVSRERASLRISFSSGGTCTTPRPLPVQAPRILRGARAHACTRTRVHARTRARQLPVLVSPEGVAHF